MTGHKDDSLSDGPPPERNIPRSKTSQVRSCIRFVNKTVRRVDVVWLNYQGQGVKYRTLPPDGFVDVNTYVGHPWIFRDSITGDKLCIHFCDIYMPEPCSWPTHTRRKIVHITIPVYSLKQRCLQIVRKLVPQQNVTELEIPRLLQHELLHSDQVPFQSVYHPVGGQTQQQAQPP